MDITRQLKTVIGRNRGKLAHYRDFTLGVLAGMCLSVGYIFASLALSPRGSPPDRVIAVGAFAGMVLCIFLSPNRMLILIGAFASVSGLTILKLFTGPSLTSFITAAVPLSITAVLCVVNALIEARPWS
jgi:ABC-type enterobactin transport system permease subunit